MRVFVVVVEAGSLSAGARRAGLSGPSATRIVDALEVHLGVKLLRRTTRALSLTAEGSAYLDACRSVLLAVEDADRTAAGARRLPRGEHRGHRHAHPARPNGEPRP